MKKKSPSLLLQLFSKKNSYKRIGSIIGFVISIIVISLYILSDGNIKQKNIKLLLTNVENIQSSILGIKDHNIDESAVRVTRVIDGDTIELENGDKVRYIGIDTPESKHPTKEVEYFAQEAAGKNKELVEGRIVQLEKDVSETDRYGRLLRYVYVGDIFVNKYLVEEGYAQAVSYPPDIKYQESFQQAGKYAQEHKKGLWAEENTKK